MTKALKKLLWRIEGHFDRRRAERQLHALSDIELHDMGLSRGNIHSVVSHAYEKKK